jgi:hypothetical protein
MSRFSSSRCTLPFASSVVAIALLLAPSAHAQRKKPKKKPPATTTTAPTPPAKPAPDTTKTAPPAEPPPPSTNEGTETKGPPKTPLEPEPEEKSKQKEKPQDLEPEKHVESGGVKPVLLDLEVGARGFQRHLSYRDDLFHALPSYDLGGAPAATVAFGVYPIKTSSGSFTLGLTGSFEYAFALGSTYKTPQAGQEGKTYTTKAMQYAIGLRGNFIFGTNTVGIGAEYGSQTFEVDLPPPVLPTATSAGNAGVPDVSYTFVRPNVTARFGLGDKVALLVGAGYLIVMSAGEIESADYFPADNGKASVAGVDANIGIAYEIANHIELRPRLDFRRYFYKFKPDIDYNISHWVAGGALDDYYGISVTLGFRF